MAIKHDVWKNNEGLTALILSGDLGEEGRQLLEPDYEIIHSFDAESHFDAMVKYYHFMNWGDYETDFEIDKAPYNIEELRKRKERRNIQGNLRQ